MQETSELYKKLIADKNHYFEISVAFNGADPDSGYGTSYIYNLNTYKKALADNSLNFGNCICGEIELDMKYIPENIPARCEITPYVRVRSGAKVSEWIKKGTFYIDTRQTDPINAETRHIRISGYDAMIKAEDDYSETNLDWPAKDIDVVEEIANSMEVPVNSETVAKIKKAYLINMPFQYSKRETLSYIAAMYGGNFIINDLGELTLIQLSDFPPKPGYLSTEDNFNIIFGEVAIIV